MRLYTAVPRVWKPQPERRATCRPGVPAYHPGMSSAADPTRPANRLAGETSPYLLQHAHNPVDWYPWGPEALERARELDRPIFLSIGYAACHWCHVMERESFEDETTAARPQRALRPDQGGPRGAPGPRRDLHGRGPGDDRPGRLADDRLPDPGGRPFYGGTYFPAPRHGMPAFRDVLDGRAPAPGATDAARWSSRRRAHVHVGRAACRLGDGDGPPGVEVLAAAAGGLEASALTPVNGGWGSARSSPSR